MHSHKDESCICSEDLTNLLGSALTSKLIAEANTAAKEVGDDFMRQITAALKARSGLFADELTHLNDKAKEEALANLNYHYTKRILCSLLNMSVLIAFASGETAATYIGHAAAHFENELTLRALEPILAAQATRIKDEAVSRTGPNN